MDRAVAVQTKFLDADRPLRIVSGVFSWHGVELLGMASAATFAPDRMQVYMRKAARLSAWEIKDE